MGEVVRKERLLEPGMIIVIVVILTFFTVNTVGDLHGWAFVITGILALFFGIVFIGHPIALIGRDGIVLIKGISRKRIEIPREEITLISVVKYNISGRYVEYSNGLELSEGVEIWISASFPWNQVGVMVDTRDGTHYVLGGSNPGKVFELLKEIY